MRQTFYAASDTDKKIELAAHKAKIEIQTNDCQREQLMQQVSKRRVQEVSWQKLT